MKKNFKKSIALLLSVIMILAMSVSVFATNGSYTITINKMADGTGVPSANTYKAYLVASFDVNNGVDENYVIQDPFKSVVADEVSLMAYAKQEYDDSTMQTLAKKLAACVANTTPSAGTSTNGVITVNQTGYYLLIETEHGDGDVAIETRFILIAVNADKTVTLKSSKPSVIKKILLENSVSNVSETPAGSKVDNDVVAIGDTVTYQLTATIPNYPDVVNNNDSLKKVTFKLTDVMSDGLTYGNVTSVNVDGTLQSLNTGYTVSSSSITGGTQIEITIDPDVVLANRGKEVVVELTGVLNENANTGATGNPNSVDLTYTNHWSVTGVPDDEGKTDEDTVITYTGELNILKIDKKDEQSTTPAGLSGAVFNIKKGDEILTFTAVKDKTDTTKVLYYRYDKDGNVTEVVTGSDGTLKLVGLDNGTYTAVEKTAPKGYTIDDKPQNLVLSVSADQLENEGDPVQPFGTSGTASNNEAERVHKATWKVNNADVAKITNEKGVTLPGTGGIGTTIFTFGGLALVILAAVLFIVYTKKQRNQA